jgi:hypothetical protein
MSSAEIRVRLRGILLTEWDPLCVGDNPNLADEYDRYIPVLLSLLQQNAEQAAISRILQKIEQDEFGMQTPSPGIEKAATDIWLLKPR